LHGATCALTTFSPDIFVRHVVVMSAVVVRMPAIGFKFTTMQYFWLAAITGFCIRHLATDFIPTYPGARNQAGREHIDHHQGTAHGRLGFAIQDTSTSWARS